MSFKTIIIMCAAIVVGLLAVFGLWYFLFAKQFDSPEAAFSSQILPQFAKNWDQGKLTPYLANEYAVGWATNLREEIPTLLQNNSTPADVDALFSQARDTLGDLKTLFNTHCDNESGQITCFSGAAFEKNKSMIVLGMREVSQSGSLEQRYKVNLLVIEKSLE